MESFDLYHVPPSWPQACLLLSFFAISHVGSHEFAVQQIRRENKVEPLTLFPNII